MKKPLLILDLDETLMHASTDPHFEHDFRLWEYRIKKRPFLSEFLQVCFVHFEVAVWTSSSDIYAFNAVQEVFPETERLKFMWARSQCVHCWDDEVQGFVWAKPLQKVRHPLQRILVIDDSPEKFRAHPSNLLLIPPYYGDPADTELMRMAIRLPGYRDLLDVRKPEKRWWFW